MEMIFLQKMLMFISQKVLKRFFNTTLFVTHSMLITGSEPHPELKFCNYSFYGASYLDAQMLQIKRHFNKNLFIVAFVH